MRCVFNWLNFIFEMIDFNYIQCRMFTDHRTKKYMILSFDKKSFSYQLRRMEKYTEHTICRIYEDGRWTTSSFVGVRAHERTTNISIIIMIWSDLIYSLHCKHVLIRKKHCIQLIADTELSIPKIWNSTRVNSINMSNHIGIKLKPNTTFIRNSSTRSCRSWFFKPFRYHILQ